MTPIEIILVVIALTFIVLVVFAVKVSNALICSLKNINVTLASLHKQINDLDDRPRNLLEQANTFSTNLNQKMKCLDPLFNSISNIGEGIECATTKYKEAALLKFLDERMNEKKEESKSESISDGIDLALRALNLWQKLKK